MLILLALPSTREPPCTPECVGGGEAVPRRGLGGPWLGRPLRLLTVSRGLSARIVSITPPPGHYEPGAVGLHRRSERSDRRAVSDWTAAWRTSRTRTARDAGRPAPLKQSRAGALASRSPRFIARPSRPEARPERTARAMTHAFSRPAARPRAGA